MATVFFYASNVHRNTPQLPLPCLIIFLNLGLTPAYLYYQDCFMILNRPFPLDFPSRQSFRYTFYAALCVFLILVLLQPFGIDEAKNPLTLFSCGFIWQ